MKKSLILGALGVLVLLGGAGCTTSVESPSSQTSTPTPSAKRYVISDPQKCEGARFTCNQGEEYFNDAQGCGCQPASVTTPVVITDPTVTAPAENSKIKSPVTITGEAPGVWFFEGQFPVVVTDKNEKELGHGIVKALGDAQTEKPVKFSGTVTFTNPNNVDSGFIIFKKDNPSGDPKNDRRYRISVLFDAAQKICTTEYQPVCGEVEVQCIKAPCPPLKQTYGNRCVAESAGAKNIVDGECKQTAPSNMDMIKIFNPAENSTITSPLSLNGEAQTSLFDKGKLYVTVWSQDGVVLGNGWVTAGSAGTTKDRTKFSGNIVFNSGTSTIGRIVIDSRDTPDVKNYSYSIKVNFAPAAVFSFPLKDTIIASPVTVQGQAPGTWFSEGSLPIEVTDSAGKILGVTPVQASGDWKTTKLVKFAGKVTFAKSTDTTGFIVLKRDNPSGDPLKDKSVKLSIRF